MLYIESNGTIKLTRGDSATLYITVNHETISGSYKIADNDTLRLTVRKTTKSDEVCFQKVVTGSDAFHIEPSDTSDLEFGKYKYDVELTTESGEVYTIIEPSNFQILEEVSY
jgi:hypothetical protein